MNGRAESIRNYWRWATSCIAIVGVFFVGATVSGEILITITESDAGIAIVAEGKANVSALSFGADGLVGNSDFAFHAGSGMVRVGPVASTRARTYSGLSGPTVLGGNLDGRTVVGDGDVVGILAKRQLLVMPAGYVSGTPVYGTTEYPGLSLGDLGVEEGTFRWTWGERVNGDSLVVRIESDLRLAKNERPNDLMQNGSFEQGLHPWTSGGGHSLRRGNAAHDESFLNLGEGRYVEQVINLFPGRYQLEFAFAASRDLTETRLNVLLLEQGVSFEGLIDQTYTLRGAEAPTRWRYRSEVFEVPERLGSRFRQLSLRFSSRSTEVLEPGEGALIDDVQVYNLDDAESQLLALRGVPGHADRFEVILGRPGTVHFDFTTNFVHWFRLGETVRGLDRVVPFRDKNRDRGENRFYRGYFESSIQLPLEASSKEEPLLVWINPGTFVLGSDETDKDRDSDEGPLTTVTLARPYAIGVHEVTQAQYEALMHVNPSRFRFDSTHPVTNMRWSEAVEYCRRLTAHERSEGRLPVGFEYRLPTEAEWDFACAAGNYARYFYGDDPDYSDLGKHAWYSANSDGVSQPVMSREPNAWGIHGMLGNAHEWCLDVYGPYPGGEVTDPRGPEPSGPRDLHVIRGGSWLDAAKNCRRADRHRDWFETYVGDLGFRVVLASQETL